MKVKTITVTLIIAASILFMGVKYENNKTVHAQNENYMPVVLKDYETPSTEKVIFEILELTNKERIENGLAPLQYNVKLEKAAIAKANDMLEKQYWAHYGPNNETPWQFIIGADYNYAYAGENLAKGFTDAEKVNTAWMNSETHRKNILDKQFTEIGITIVEGKLDGVDTHIIVQMFGSTQYEK